MTTRDEAIEFANEWNAAWNARDLEGVLALFDDNVVFTSPTALVVVGTKVVRGKAALRANWTAALERITSLQFTIDRVMWDSTTRELAIIYVSEIDGQSKRVSENLMFSPSGLVASAEVFHGVAGS
jgi:ketosteroid isomerase-like protein